MCLPLVVLGRDFVYFDRACSNGGLAPRDSMIPIRSYFEGDPDLDYVLPNGTLDREMRDPSHEVYIAKRGLERKGDAD